MTGDGPQDRPAGGCRRKQATADRREREERDDDSGSQTRTAAEHATDPGRGLVLARDFHLAVRTAMDDRGVVGVHQPLLRVELLHQVVVRLGGLEVGVNAGEDHECVDSHLRTSWSVGCAKSPLASSNGGRFRAPMYAALSSTQRA